MTTIRAHFDGRVLIPDGPVDLPKNTPLEVDVRVPAAAGGLLDLASIAREFPASPEAPRDRAKQHEHYLYGVTK